MHPSWVSNKTISSNEATPSSGRKLHSFLNSLSFRPPTRPVIAWRDGFALLNTQRSLSLSQFHSSADPHPHPRRIWSIQPPTISNTLHSSIGVVDSSSSAATKAHHLFFLLSEFANRSVILLHNTTATPTRCSFTAFFLR